MPTPLGGATGGLPIDQLIHQTKTGPPAPQQQLGEDAFLKLLTTELRNQNPLKPIDATQQTAQLAQFSALQAQNALKASFEKFQSNFAVTQAATLIGKSVSVNATTSDGQSAAMVKGTVKAVAVQDGQPYFTMLDSHGNTIVDKSGTPRLFNTNQIVGIGG